MFLCFSSGDRYGVVKSCLYHLKNYGISVWYDYHELILGDTKKEKNFEHAIKNNKYFIIIYSENLFKSSCAVEEEKRIFNELKLRQIIIFPLLYNLKFSELPIEYQRKLENYIYNEINDNTGTLNSINQVVTKVLIDKITTSSFEETPTLAKYNDKNIKDFYVQHLLEVYNHISKDNFNSRITLLFSLYYYIKYKYEINAEIYYVCDIIEYLFKFTNLNIEYNHKEIIIAELSIVLLLKNTF